MDYTNKELESLHLFFNKTTPQFNNQKLVLSQSLNETWFSNILAWLLNPKASHGYRKDFSLRFLHRVAEIKKKGGKEEFSQNPHFLKNQDTAGAGNRVNKLKLQNSTTVREFFISTGTNKTAKYCDLVLLDLDYNDSVIVAIENKLFSTNHPYQLQEYYNGMEKSYNHAKIRDYVYLTIDGSNPKKFGVVFGDGKSKKEKTLYKNWVTLSWADDILKIIKLSERGIKRKNPPHEIKVLIKLLTLIQKLKNDPKKAAIDNYRKQLIHATRDCLLERLEFFEEKQNKDTPSKWMKKGRYSLKHRSCKRREVKLSMLPNFTITIQTQNKSTNKPIGEKIIIPFGVHSDQFFNLISYAANDVYNYHFTGTKDPGKFRNNKWVTTANTKKTEIQNSYFELIKFANEHIDELKIMMSLCTTCQQNMVEQQKNDIQNEEEPSN